MDSIAAGPHPFDQAIALVSSPRNVFIGRTSDDYQNMVGPFGGITAATLLNAVLQHPGRIGEPVSMTVNFAAAIEPGEFEVEAVPIRTNRSTQHWQLTQKQSGQAVTTATVFCAVRSETWAEQELEAPSIEKPEELARLETAHRRAWVANYEFRFSTGAYDPDNSEEQSSSQSTLWIRDNPPRPLDFPALAALGDSFFPRLFTRTQRFFPAGTVSLTLHFHADSLELASVGREYVLGSARANRAYRSYHDQSAYLWSSAGRLLLSSTQMMYYKA